MSIFGIFLPVFSHIRTEYREILHCLHIQSKCEKIRTRKIPNTDTFHVVIKACYYFNKNKNNVKWLVFLFRFNFCSIENKKTVYCVKGIKRIGLKFQFSPIFTTFFGILNALVRDNTVTIFARRTNSKHREHFLKEHVEIGKNKKQTRFLFWIIPPITVEESTKIVSIAELSYISLAVTFQI